MDINLEELDADGIYVYDSSYDEGIFLGKGYHIEKFDYYAVAYMEDG